MRPFLSTAVATCAVALAVASASAQDFLERGAVVMYYHTMYLPTANVASGWTGDVATCNAGSTSTAFKNAVFHRINFYRLLSGLGRVSRFADSKDIDVQNAALMMSANGAVNNSPPASWNCYTASGYNGAFNSILALGVSGVDAVEAYLEAAGDSAAAGRRWLLYPPQQQLAIGDIPSGTQSNAIWTLGPWGSSTGWVTTPGLWPPKGYVPWDTLPAASNRWSFSLPGANFGNVGNAPSAQIVVGLWTPPVFPFAQGAIGENIAAGYGNETLVFRPANVNYSRPDLDVRYDVQISGITGSQFGTRTYSVNIIDAEQLPGGLTADFDGDGKDDIVWHNPLTGQTSVWLMNGAGFAAGSRTLRIDPNWRPALSGDFNGDGKADILWRRDDTGETEIWLMDGSNVVTSASLLVSTGWRATHVGDFNGDGKADIVWHSAPFGAGYNDNAAIWLMDGAQVLGSANVTSNGRVTHIGDFNGDGKQDLVVRDFQFTRIYLMNGLTPLQVTQIAANGNEFVTHVGDFNGDGRSDLLSRNYATGDSTMRLMNGVTTVTNSILLTHADWRVVDVADFNGDGKSDLLWRNRATGEVAIWQMDGTYFQNGAIILGLPEWQVAKVGNFNGDVGSGGKPKHDLLWRNSTTGQHAIWLMNGFTFTAGAIVLNGTQWWAAP
jgi:hypothetical protein